MTVEPEIPRYYAGKKILVTGGSGYMGKMLIWKLLTSCPLLDTIYMLIRPKRGKTSMSRRDEVFGNMMFDEIKKKSPGLLTKVVLISGDVSEDGIGLAQCDRDVLIDQVSIIFHGAAVLKMNADLKFAVRVNTEGTLKLLKLAEEMKKLEAFLYLSTAYCCCENDVVEEKIYPFKHNAYDIINLVRWLDPEILKILTPKLIHPLPNTYTYSKRLTESIFLDFASRIPIIISRPTIVVPSFKEPVPGWFDNTNGPIGLCLAVGKGVIRSVIVNKTRKANMVSVDVAINGILTLPWANLPENLLGKVTVYNIGETEHEPYTWQHIEDLGLASIAKYPFEKTLWYPNFDICETNLIRHKIKVFFFHWIPAYVIDFIMILINQKPFLVYVQKKIQDGEKVLTYFMQREWSFENNKLLRIKDKMNETDKQIFPVTMKAVTDDQWYMDRSLLFGRKYICHEDPSTIESSKRKMKLMYLLDKFVLVLRYFFLIKILMLVLQYFL